MSPFRPGQSFARPRARMVEQQLRARGIRDERVLAAMAEVPRHLFVDPALASRAYHDCSLPIGEGQTISQPYTVARMTELLELGGTEQVLEIGTGCGYQTAVLALLCRRVFSIERIRSLADRARVNLRRARLLGNVRLKCGDGLLGWPEYAPFDAILVTAGGFASPAWIEQLREGGVLLMPKGENGRHHLVRMRKHGSSVSEEVFDACTFVPLRSGVSHH